MCIVKGYKLVECCSGHFLVFFFFFGDSEFEHL